MAKGDIMKKKLLIVGSVIFVIAGFTVFFALQATPGNVLNAVRAQKLEIVDGTLTVPEKYAVIEADTLSGMADFDKVVLRGEKRVCAEAFYGCPNLEEVTIEDACQIEERAFADCPRLKTVTANSPDVICADDAFRGHGGITIYCREDSEILAVAKRSDLSFKIID